MAIVGSFALTARAAPLAVGSTIVAVGEPEPVALIPIDTLIAPINAATFTGTLITNVYSDPGNALGGLTFTYQIINDAGSPHAIERFTINNFDGFLTDASYQSPLPAGDVAPSLVNRSAAPGDVVGFTYMTFIGPPVNFGNGVILPGTSSAVMVIETDAPSYQRTLASVINGSVAMPEAFAPVPEPGTLALASLGLVGLFAVARRARRR